MGLINMVYPCYSFSRISSAYLKSVVSCSAYLKRFESFGPLKSLLIVENLWVHRQLSSITLAIPYPEPQEEALVGNFSLIGLAISSTSQCTTAIFIKSSYEFIHIQTPQKRP
jgi:hypothetical protein